jgi:hypothetical protein
MSHWRHGRSVSGAQPRSGLHISAGAHAETNSLASEADREFAVCLLAILFLGMPCIFMGAVYLLLVS